MYVNGRPAPCTITLKYVDRDKIELNYGDIVHRHLQDGDIGFFNRQPSLHRMSMMAHRIKVVQDKTFRLNVTVCKPYNADFDGDEMNMHLPQSIQSRYELEHLTLVPTQIIDPGKCQPVIYIVQDTIIGSYELTQDDKLISKEQLNNIMMFSKRFNGNLPKPKVFINNKPYLEWKTSLFINSSRYQFYY